MSEIVCIKMYTSCKKKYHVHSARCTLAYVTQLYIGAYNQQIRQQNIKSDQFIIMRRGEKKKKKRNQCLSSKEQ